jgi:hypothetical protein
VNEALRQALELQAVLVAARYHEDNSKTYRKYRSPPPNEDTEDDQGAGGAENWATSGITAPMKGRLIMKCDENTKIGQADTHGNCQETATDTRTGRVPNRRETSDGRRRRANADVCNKAPPSRIDRHHGKCRS